MTSAKILKLIVPLSASVLMAVPGLAQEVQRQLGAHVHGHGTLNIAVEGSKVTIELEAPGDDIVGFEHEAKTAKQKAAIEAAKTRLSAPLTLLVPLPAAGCKATSAKVELESGAHHGEAAPAAKTGDKAEGEAEHSGFHAEYTLECSNIAALTMLDVRYFKAFAKAQELDVSLIGPKGQTKLEVTREKPSLDLRSVM